MAGTYVMQAVDTNTSDLTYWVVYNAPDTLGNHHPTLPPGDLANIVMASRIVPDSPGEVFPSERTFDAVETALTGQPAGTTCKLMGQSTKPIATFMIDSNADIYPMGPLDLTQADGTEFTEGATSAFNIQVDSGILTWNFGTGLEISNAQFRWVCLGQGTRSNLKSFFRYDVNVSAPASGMQLDMGSLNRAANHLVAASIRDSAGTWQALCAFSNPAAPSVTGIQNLGGIPGVSGLEMVHRCFHVEAASAQQGVITSASEDPLGAGSPLITAPFISGTAATFRTTDTDSECYVQATDGGGSWTVTLKSIEWGPAVTI